MGWGHFWRQTCLYRFHLVPLLPLTFCSLVSPLISPSQILLKFASSLLLHLYSECMRNRVHLTVIEGGSNYLTIIMFNAGNVRSDRAQTFLGRIYDLISTIHLKTPQNCQRMNEFTHLFIRPVIKYSLSILPGLMLAPGDTWPLCFRCLGSSETSRQ